MNAAHLPADGGKERISHGDEKRSRREVRILPAESAPR